MINENARKINQNAGKTEQSSVIIKARTLAINENARKVNQNAGKTETKFGYVNNKTPERWQ